MQPGGGKTSIVCWAAKIINQLFPNLEIVIGTTTPHLRRQLEAFSKQFSLLNTRFVDLTDLHYVDSESVIIFDEYYHAVYKNPMNINGNGIVLGIHGLR